MFICSSSPMSFSSETCNNSRAMLKLPAAAASCVPVANCIVCMQICIMRTPAIEAWHGHENVAHLLCDLPSLCHLYDQVLHTSRLVRLHQGYSRHCSQQASHCSIGDFDHAMKILISNKLRLTLHCRAAVQRRRGLTSLASLGLQHLHQHSGPSLLILLPRLFLLLLCFWGQPTCAGPTLRRKLAQ